MMITMIMILFGCDDNDNNNDDNNNDYDEGCNDVDDANG